MNASDLARLQVAKRAFLAAQPSEAEVQTGVRRARLWLRRPKQRRGWFSKGLVLVVLALGSLAYAKPQALSELMDKRTPSSGSDEERGKGRVLLDPVDAPALASQTQPAHLPASPLPSAEPLPSLAARAPAALRQAPPAAAARSKPPLGAEPPRTEPAPQVAANALVPVDATRSGWGGVAEALARGDEGRALAALTELAKSDDSRTRDKADLGRAQLLMARGDTARACALAQSLTQRRAGGHVERQALSLLKSCER